ncbi:hypothetical protein Golob_023978, partial [Gossypium lobatum]|nr:hypothetical protein [Gossypium lobatum]
MAEAESFVELGPMKDKFESSKPNGKGNDERNHEEDEKGHNNDGNRPHMTRKCLKKSMISAIEKKDELNEVKPVEEKTSMVNSMVLFCKNMDGEEGLMFVDINIEGLKWSALIDTGASNLFISKKAVKKLGLSIRKPNKKIKMVNSKEALTVGVVRNVELQIGEWKSNEEFEDSGSSVSMGRSNSYCHRSVIKNYCAGALDMKVGTKVLLSIQLVEDVLYKRNINSIKWNVTKALSKKLVEHETDMRPVKLIVEPPHLRNVGCVLDFDGKEAMQKHSKRVNAASK